jgi:Zn-dependent protease
MIVLRSTGGMSVVEGRYETARGAALFAAGGPLASATVTVALVVAGLQLPAPFGMALILPAFLNALVLGVNLLPLAPMDGYMLFRAAVWAKVGSREEADRCAMGWSRALLGWAAFCSLVVLARNPVYGLLALFLVGTFALQHHAVASSAAHSGLPAHRRS